MTFLPILEITKILFSVRIAVAGKADRDLREASRLELSELISANMFSLYKPDDNLRTIKQRSDGKFTS